MSKGFNPAPQQNLSVILMLIGGATVAFFRLSRANKWWCYGFLFSVLAGKRGSQALPAHEQAGIDSPSPKNRNREEEPVSVEGGNHSAENDWRPAFTAIYLPGYA